MMNECELRMANGSAFIADVTLSIHSQHPVPPLVTPANVTARCLS